MESVPITQQFQVGIASSLLTFINSPSKHSKKASLSLWPLMNKYFSSYVTLLRMCSWCLSHALSPRPIKFHVCTVYIYRLLNQHKQYSIVAAYQVQQSAGSQIRRSVASLNQKKHCDMPNNKNQIKQTRLAEHRGESQQFLYGLGFISLSAQVCWSNHTAYLQIMNKSLSLQSHCLLRNLWFLLSTTEF